MIRAALKSLLGRKVRLLMSTFAIVLGVAFVAGSLIFSDTLSRSFTALFASTVGDVVVRPEGATAPASGASSHRDRPGVRASTSSSRCAGAARVDGNVSAFGVYVVGTDNKVVGGSRPAGDRRQLVRRARRPRLAGPRASSTGDEPHGADEVVLDEQHRRAGRLRASATQVAASSPRADQARADPDAGRHRRLPRGRLAQRRDVRRLRHPDRAGPVPRRRGRLHRHLGDRRGRRLPGGAARRGRARCCPTASRPSPATTPPTRRPADLLEAISFLTTFLLIFAGISLVVGALPHRQHLLDPGRPAQPRARPAARPRRLQAAGDPVGAARGVRASASLGSTLGLGLGVLLAMGIRGAVRATFGLDLSGQPLIFAPRTVLACVRRRRPRHHGGGVAAGPPDRPDRAGAGAARRHRAARDLDPPPAAARASR